MRIAHLAEQGPQLDDELIDLLRVEDHEVVGIDVALRGFADAGGDELDRALEKLRAAFDADVVAVIETAVILLAGVPHAGSDRPAAVREVELQVEVSVAIGS